MSEWQQKTEKRLDELEREQAEMKKDFARAFPGGDAEGHRRYHEALIEENQIRKDLVKAIREKSVAGLVWAALVWLTAAVWNEAKRRAGIP